jgi:hypothetical protein
MGTRAQRPVRVIDHENLLGQLHTQLHQQMDPPYHPTTTGGLQQVQTVFLQYVLQHGYL